MMRSLDYRAILLATLAVFGIDYFSGMALVAAYGAPLTNASEEQLKLAAEALMRNSGYLRGALILGTASTVVGIGVTVPAALLGAYFGRRPLSK